jgi:parallel beta-helix repeat protein
MTNIIWKDRNGAGHAVAVLVALSITLLASAPAEAVTMITTCPQVLSTPGETYVLTNDLAMPNPGIALQITADNVHLVGNGHTIKGPGAISSPKSIGVEVVGTKGVGVQGVVLTDFTLGIRVRSATATHVSQCRGLGNLVGIQIASADRNSVTGSRFSSNAVGVYLATANHNMIAENEVADNTVSSPDALSGFAVGVFVASSDGNTILGNAILRNRDVGVWLYFGANQNTIRNNEINVNTRTGITSNGTNNRILQNRVLENTDGIGLAKGATGHLIQNNRVLGNSHLDMTDLNLPGCVNMWQNNVFNTDNDPGACIQ